MDGISFYIREGETLGLVGESGCGKTVSALSIMRLIPIPPGKIESGQISFNGKDLSTLDDEEIRKIRGKEIAMVFQEPMSSLNPVFSIGFQLCEVLKRHLGMRAREAGTLADEAALEAAIATEVANSVRRQLECGIHVVNDGECGKPSFLGYIGERLSGFEARIQTARALAGGQDAIDRFLKWKLPPGDNVQDQDAALDLVKA